MGTFSVTGVLSIDCLEQGDVKLTCLGGSAVYTAIILARLGHKVHFWGQVGTDFEQSLLDEVQHDDIQWQLRVVSGTTARIHLICDAGGHLSRFHYEPGVGGLMCAEALGESFWASKYVWLGTAPPEYHRAVMQKAASYGQVVYLSPQGDYAGNFAALSRLLPYLHGLFLNKREVQELCGDTLEQAIGRLREVNPRLLCVITCGRHGAILVWQKDLYRVNALAQNVVNATGSGDVFAVSLVHRLLAGMEIAESLAFAAVAAAISLRDFAYRAVATEGEVLGELTRRRQEITVQRARWDSAQAREWLREGNAQRRQY